MGDIKKPPVETILHDKGYPDNDKGATFTSDDKLRVEAAVAESVGAYIHKFLKNGSSINLNIDGSTPVSFVTDRPLTDKKWYVKRISLLIRSSSINLTKFGGISALSNGIELKVKQNGGTEESVITSIKVNYEFLRYFNKFDILSYNIDVLWVVLDLPEGAAGSLTYTGDDYVKIIVKDDLTGLGGFTAHIEGYEVDE